MTSKWVLPAIILAVLVGAFLLRWDHKASTTISEEGEKGVVEYKLDRWTGRTWIEAYLITPKGLVVIEQLASSPPSGGEGWAKSERDFLTALWLDLLILCAAWLLATLQKWLPKITPKAGRRAVIAALIGLIAVNSVLGYGWLWYYLQGQANLRLLEAHRIWEAAFHEDYSKLLSSIPESDRLFDERKYAAIGAAIAEASQSAEKYTQETTGISGAGGFSEDYINSVLADIGDAKRQLLRLTMDFSVICMALIIVLRAMMANREKCPLVIPSREPPQG